MENIEYQQALTSVHDHKMASTPNWQACLIDLANPIPQPEPLIIQTDTDIAMLHRRNISTIAAAAKVGKTFLISSIAVAALHNDGFLGFHAIKELKVLFIDTEMDSSDTQIVAIRVHQLTSLPTNINNSRFTALNLREQDNDQRLAIVETAIKELQQI